MKKSIQLPPPGEGRPDLLLIAGEHSGDQHAALAVRALRTRRPDLKIAALGGPAIERAGARLLHDMTATSVVGLVEVLTNLSEFKELFARTVDWIREHRPRAICFVDYPGFNLRLARALHEAGISHKAGGDVMLLYYISPQIWAWKGKRRFAMARMLDALAVIFPFEVNVYADTDLPVDFVGHPFLSEEHESKLTYDPGGPLLLLPGSRRIAVGRIFPVLLDAFAALRRELPDQRAAVIYPDGSILSILRAELDRRPDLKDAISLVEKDERTGGRAVVTSSGTMSLSCALAGLPGAIVYRANWLTYLIGRTILKIPYLGICNLLLEKPMYPEFIQGRADPEMLAREIRKCLESPERLMNTKADAERLREILSASASSGIDAWLEKHLAVSG